jgi:hypothetical protein
MDPRIDRQLAGFFAWARPRAYAEFDQRMREDPSLDPNWTFSEIMQRLLVEYQRLKSEEAEDHSASSPMGGASSTV